MNERYQVIREPDNRYVVIDALNKHTWVSEPMSAAAARRLARDLNKSHARGEQG